MPEPTWAGNNPPAEGGGGGGGGGLDPATNWLQLSGAPVTFTDNDGGLLPFGSYGDGNAGLLDLTDPLNPVVMEDGVYAVTAVVRCEGVMAPDGLTRVALLLDRNGKAASAYFTLTGNDAADAQMSFVTPSNTVYIPAGGIIQVTISVGGGGAGDYRVADVTIQRLA